MIRNHLFRLGLIAAAILLNGTSYSQTNRTPVTVRTHSTAHQIRTIPGGALAGFGAHKVTFDAALESVGITTPGNQSLSFRPMMLAYYDSSSGQSVLLAQVQDTVGQVELPNHVRYQSTFDNIDADIEYECDVNSLEQNIVLRQSLPLPSDFGLNPDTTRLEMWTEWLGATPSQQTSTIALGARMQASDTALDFGTMKIVRGKAFATDNQSASIPVAKDWQLIQGRTFLIEAVDYDAIQLQLQVLLAGTALVKPPVFKNQEQMVMALAKVRNIHANPRMQLASAVKPSKGVVLDFTIVDSIPMPQGAIAWWPAGGNANDVIGNNNGTLEGDAGYAAGEVGQGFSFDGSGDVNVPGSDLWAFGYNDFTIECWFNLRNLPQYWWWDYPDAVLVANDEGPYDVNKWIFGLFDGNLTLLVDDPDNGPVGAVQVPFNPDMNTWYHVALTRQDGVFFVYTNGVLAGTNTISSYIPNAEGPLTIGQAEGIGYVNGVIDEVAIYNRALSGSEVASIYSAGGAGKNNPDCVEPSTNLVGWWAGDGNADDLVNTNNGTLQGAAICTPGEVGQAFDLDGYDSYVQAPDSDLWAFGSNDFTMECWFNLRSLQEYYWWDYPNAVFIANDEGPYDVNKWIFGLFNGTLTLLVDDPVNGPVTVGVVPFNPDMNTWYHVALTRQGTIFTAYVNGLPVGSNTNSAVIPNANGPLTIGQAEDIGYVDGQIDEVGIYNRALSDSEVAAIYSAGGAGKCKTDLDFDGLPDWWELKYFGTLAYSGTNLDTVGNTLLYDYQNNLDPNVISFTVRLGNQNFNTTNATGNYVVVAGTPSYETVLVNDTNLNDAVWIPYDGNISMNLGPTDGVYQVQFGLKGRASGSQVTWMGTEVTLNRQAPQITITSPTNGVQAQPYLQLQGYAAMPLAKVTYNFNGTTNNRGSIISHTLDPNTLSYTTDYFQCFDIPLAVGSNNITLHATDPAGNSFTTNINVKLDYSIATNPVINLTWPQDGAAICGDSFTLRGWTEDSTAKIVATVNGTNVVTGVVERDGKLWAENLPLSAGTNTISLAVTNAAGLSSVTNFNIVKSTMTLALTSVDGDLWLPTVNVSGVISDPAAPIWVNGVQGTNNGDGTWNASNVPVSKGGIASFDLSTIPPGAPDPVGNTNCDKPVEIVMESASGGYINSENFQTVWWNGQWGWNDTNGGNQQMKISSGTNWYKRDDTIAPNLNITLEHYYTSDGMDLYTTNVGTTSFAQAIGRIAGVVYLPWVNPPWNTIPWTSSDSHSLVKMTLHTGGLGVAGQKILVAVTATATEQLNGALGSSNMDSTAITIPGLGKNLQTNGWAFGTASSGDPVDVTPTVNVPYYSFTVGGGAYAPTSETYHPALSDKNRARTDLGVGEEVTIKFQPPLSLPTGVVLGWSTTAGSVDASGYFVAPSNAASATVTATVTNCSDLTSVDVPTFEIKEPSGFDPILSYIYGFNTISPGIVGVDMFVKVVVEPINVSFYRITCVEPNTMGISRIGYFLDPLLNGDLDDTHSGGGSFLVGDNNMFSDHCGVSGLPQPPVLSFSGGGSFEWNYYSDTSKWPYWIIDPSKTNKISWWDKEVFSIDGSGTVTVSKWGCHRSRTINNVIQ